jgi:hypothetical protein
MGWFSKKPRASTNRFVSHSDVLDKMARDGARIALQQIKEDISMTRKPATYCEVGAWALDFNDKPLEKYVCSGCGMYGLKYNDYGMEDVPEGSDVSFLSAIEPYLKKHLEENYKRYFPEAYGVSAYQTSYETENKWTEGYTTHYAIMIEVRGARDPNWKPEPTYKKW